MKRLVAFLLIAMISFAYSQVVNINPNPNGEPIFTGGYIYDEDEQEFIEGLPILIISDEVKEYDLPDS
ncbi:MAG: hypothetical protein KKD38_01420 [Candidatus Delongbacteria bacterium]|nr:hypothetical protein [Candidatus Delongbacteria bacterium]